MRYSKELEELKSNNLYRELRKIKVSNPFAYINGKRYLLLSSNDYLGLSRDERVLNAIKDSLEQASQCSSRLIAGNDPLLEKLEDELAKHKDMEKALVYPTGYMANLAIEALVNKSDLIVSDELNHASIIDACRLSRADVKIFKHNDINDLEDKLKGRAGNKIVITEGVFSMDGDFAKLDEIYKIVKEYDALLVLDDAHGDFIYGENFRGTYELFNIKPDIIISSLSKSLGIFGGYIVSNKEIIDYLINRSRTFIYTSALPAHLASGAIEALKIVKDGERQKRLIETCKMLRKGLLSLGFNIIGDTQIIPIIVGKEEKALKLSKDLLNNGLLVQAIRYPTVKKGSARLRLSVTSLHLEYINDILSIFKIV